MLTCQRHLFSLPDDLHYLNCAYMAPTAQVVEDAGIAGIRQKRNPAAIEPPHFFEGNRRIRMLFGRLIHAEAASVALIPSASYGLATVASNLPIERRSRIVLLADQFPSNVYVWRRAAADAGATVVTVGPESGSSDRATRWNERLLEAIDRNTAVVAVPHVHWIDGTRFDLEAVSRRARDVGAALVVDGTQSVGALPFDIRRVRPTALICAGYKWLLGPYALGVAWYSEALHEGRPLEENWISRVGSHVFNRLTDYEDRTQPGAIRFDVGERSNFILVPMLIAALELLLEWEPASIQKYCRVLTEPIIEYAGQHGFHVEPPEGRAHHLFGVRCSDRTDPERFRTALARRGVSVSLRSDVGPRFPARLQRRTGRPGADRCHGRCGTVSRRGSHHPAVLPMTPRLRSLAVHVGGGILAVGLLYLALRGVDLTAVLQTLRTAKYVWLVPLSIITLLSHLVRTWRWRILIREIPAVRNDPRVDSPTLKPIFYSLMVGYMVNYALPRLGEVARAANLAAQSRLRFSSLLGTVVAERLLDAAVLLVATGGVFLLLFDRFATLSDLFIAPGAEGLKRSSVLITILIVAAVGLSAFVSYRLHRRRSPGAGGSLLKRLGVGKGHIQSSHAGGNSTRGGEISAGHAAANPAERPRHAWIGKIASILGSFREGAATLLRSPRRGAIAVSTAVMWLLYLFMAYIPLIMFDVVNAYDLSLLDGWSIMILGSIGVAIPSPGGAGSYHYITIQTLVHLYAVAHEDAAAYAVFVHASQLVLHGLVGAICLILQGSGLPALHPPGNHGRGRSLLRRGRAFPLLSNTRPGRDPSTLTMCRIRRHRTDSMAPVDNPVRSFLHRLVAEYGSDSSSRGPVCVAIPSTAGHSTLDVRHALFHVHIDEDGTWSGHTTLDAVLHAATDTLTLSVPSGTIDSIALEIPHSAHGMALEVSHPADSLDATPPQAMGFPSGYHTQPTGLHPPALGGRATRPAPPSG